MEEEKEYELAYLRYKMATQKKGVPFLLAVTVLVLATIAAAYVTYVGLNYDTIYAPKVAAPDEWINCNESGDVINVSYCLNRYVNTFFYYNSTNQNVSLDDMTLEKLKTEGGVCRHYSQFYNLWANKLGYNAVQVTLPNINHRITIIENKTEENHSQYCVVDQSDVLGCWRGGI